MLFYISALILGVIAGSFIAAIVSSFRPNRAHELYNRLQNYGNLRYNAVNINSVLDRDNLWNDEDQNGDDTSAIRTSKPAPSKNTNKSKKVYVAGPGMFNASQFHGGAPEGIATIEVDEDQVKPMVKMVEQHPDFIRQAFAMSGKMVITLDELMNIWESLSKDKVPEGARRSARN